jgi:hypothetical protein
MTSVFSSGSPAWILLVPMIPGIVAFAMLAVTQYLRAKKCSGR